jgi:hypothetical protein
MGVNYALLRNLTAREMARWTEDDLKRLKLIR